MSVSPPLQVVIFGASGDLAVRKLLPALAALAGRQAPACGFHVVGVARRPKTSESYRSEIHSALPDELRGAFEALAPRIDYVQGDVRKLEDLEQLCAHLNSLPGGAGSGRLFYLSLRPDLFGDALRNLSQVGLVERTDNGDPFRRAIIEKPFGHDLASACALNRELQRYLFEGQIYRTDHYLGKETVQNILGLRFHNAIFEPIWNRKNVELIQITVAEQLGMEGGRAAYYDTAGAVRDMLQNHMLQVLALVAMDPPSSLEAEEIRGRKVSVLESLRLPEPLRLVRARYAEGQVGGSRAISYRDEPGVAPDSTTETYVAVRAELDSWRWSGVPILLRHGKRLAKKLTEVQVQFRTPPLQLFNRPDGVSDAEFRRAVREGTLCQIRPNVLTLSIQPREAITLSFGVKTPGVGMVMAPAHLGFDYQQHFGQTTTPAYERLLLDAMQGDATLFLRGDEIEASWRFADQVLAAFQRQDGPPLLEYPAGSWGPEEASELFQGCEGRWTSG